MLALLRLTVALPFPSKLLHKQVVYQARERGVIREEFLKRTVYVHPAEIASIWSQVLVFLKQRPVSNTIYHSVSRNSYRNRDDGTYNQWYKSITVPSLVSASPRTSGQGLEKEKLMRSERKTNDKRTVSEVTSSLGYT